MSKSIWDILRSAEMASQISGVEEQSLIGAISSLHSNTLLRRLIPQLQKASNSKSIDDVLEFCYQIDRSSPMLLFHALPRQGARNRYHSEMQQSYGDHIRLLALAIHKLNVGDVDWYYNRRSRPTDVSRSQLLEAISDFQGSKLKSSEKIALFVAAYYHDYGKLLGRSHGLDSEDACVLARPALNALCPRSYLSMVKFCITYHDYIEHVLGGAAAIGPLKSDLNSIPRALQPQALAFLGIIQLAGAASLGEGRVTRRKLRIYRDCLTGSIVMEDSVYARLARLLYGESFVVTRKALGMVADLASDLAPKDRGTLVPMIEGVSILGWPRLVKRMKANGGSHLRSLRLLLCLARLWRDQKERSHFLIVDGSVSPSQLFTLEARERKIDLTTVRLLSGKSALIVSNSKLN